jgi:hypothetical protein
MGGLRCGPVVSHISPKNERDMGHPHIRLSDRIARSLGFAHRFRPTYAMANVGHPSIPSALLVDGACWG